MERILKLEIEELEERIAPTINFPGFSGASPFGTLGGGESVVKAMDDTNIADGDIGTVVGVTQEPAHTDVFNHTPIDVSDSATEGLKRAVVGRP